MNIYTNVPYTYIIGWTEHNKWYYGVRYSKKCDPKDLWKTYFTSSKYVKEFRKKYGEPDVVQIRKTFSCIEKARLWESKVLIRLGVVGDERFLNRSIATSKMDREGMIAVKDKFGNSIDISITEFRMNRDNYIHFTDKKFSAKDKFGNVFLISKEDKRFLSGDLISIAKGTVMVRDSSGKCFRVSVNDERYISGELLHINKGKSMKNATTKHMNVLVTCPVCGIKTNKGNISRWHKHI